jgi:hypothetical protein
VNSTDTIATIAEPMQVRRVRRPKMVYVHYDYGTSCARFLVKHKDEHIKCLSEFFEVVTVSGECDIGQLCDLHAPDILAFELGLQIASARRPAVRNSAANPAIPRIGILNADAWGGTRGLILSEIARLDVDAVFSICATALEHFPGLRDKLFFWPNFIDPDVFNGGAAEKLVALAIAGNRDQDYPWRRAVYPALERNYPSIVCPHHGYVSRMRSNQVLLGRDYAKLIAAAWIAPTCGSVAMDLVRKHLEIPACGTLLLTERSPVLEAAGFRDLENCLFAASDDVLDKVGFVFDQQERLSRMIAAGRRLVLDKHTYRQRNQILQWYELNTTRKSGEVIVQDAPFSGLALQGSSDRPPLRFPGSDGLHLQLIRKGNEQYGQGRFEDAAGLYLQSLALARGMAEPKLMLAACDLRCGRVGDALQKVVALNRDTLGKYEDVMPDPVEWAYLVACYLCIGDLESARMRAAQYPTMNHCLINGIRQALGIGKEDGNRAAMRGRSGSSLSLSVHTFLVEDFTRWKSELGFAMASCGHSGLYSSLFETTVQATLPYHGRRSGKVLSQLLTLINSIQKKPLRGFDNPFVFERLRSLLSSYMSGVWIRARQVAKVGRYRQGRSQT